MKVIESLDNREKWFTQLRSSQHGESFAKNYLGHLFDLEFPIISKVVAPLDHANEEKVYRVSPQKRENSPQKKVLAKPISVPSLKDKSNVLKEYPKKITIEGEKGKEEKEREIQRQMAKIPHKKIFFINDILHDEKKILNDEQYDLFDKMILAMHLNETHFHLSALAKNQDDLSQKEINALPSHILKDIFDRKPILILSFGAKATFSLLGKEERLTRIHGQFFEKTFNYQNESFTTRVVPLFHLDFLLINNNMKKVFWNDLKKVMKYVGK